MISNDIADPTANGNPASAVRCSYTHPIHKDFACPFAAVEDADGQHLCFFHAKAARTERQLVDFDCSALNELVSQNKICLMPEWNVPGISFEFSALGKVEIFRTEAPYANFKCSILDGAKCGFSNFSFAKFNLSRMNSARFTSTKFLSSDLTGADLSHSFFSKCQFNEAKLNRARFFAAEIVNSDFSNINGGTSDFSSSKLTSVKFNSARLQGARFRFATLTNVDFSGADLRKCDFSDAVITDPILVGAKLTGAIGFRTD